MKRTKHFLSILIIVLNISLTKAETPDIAIYSEDATWIDGIIALEHFLDWKGLTHQRILSDDINSGILSDGYKVVIFPGGFAYDYKVDLNAKGEKNIKAFVDDGGGYLGICAGAFLATSTVIWEGDNFYYPLDLFQGKAVGSINEIKPWDGYAITTISLNKSNPVNKFQKPKLKVMYYGGPYFEPATNQKIDTLATWDDYQNKPAIICFKYGAGNVILSGPHPEIEENSSRDGTFFGHDLYDECSEWGWLWSAFDLLLNKEISDSSLKTSIEKSNHDITDILITYKNNSGYLYSNFNDPLHIQIFSIEGTLVMDAVLRNRININSLSSGLYIYRLQYSNNYRINKLIIAK